ncbi:hypothetical protein BDW67DRAFT_160209 [Aspergillus spinulosporus]
MLCCATGVFRIWDRISGCGVIFSFCFAWYRRCVLELGKITDRGFLTVIGGWETEPGLFTLFTGHLREGGKSGSICAGHRYSSMDG